MLPRRDLRKWKKSNATQRITEKECLQVLLKEITGGSEAYVGDVSV